MYFSHETTETQTKSAGGSTRMVMVMNALWASWSDQVRAGVKKHMNDRRTKRREPV